MSKNISSLLLDSYHKGYIKVYTTFGQEKNCKTIRIWYLVIDANTSYNILFARRSINQLMEIVSIPHLTMKFPSPMGDILTVHVDQKGARECYAESLRLEPLRNDVSPKRKSSWKDRASREAQPMLVEPIVALVDLDPRATEDRLEAREEMRRVPLLDEERNTAVGTAMVAVEVMHVVLKKNIDLFAWTPSEMPGVSLYIITHRLSVFKEARSITQKKRDYCDEKRLVAKVEVEKLLSVRFICEALYTTWLANVVMVTKSNGNWRMCVDYRNHNSACPKDSYPLPNIDHLVDGVVDHKILSFLDAYSGYNQISMHPKEKEKTVFMTTDANYYYEVTPFSLKNGGATY
ncbi:uncharacterized protein [Phaseolus vulgaris]|uniref:uncharacterized protein n=1 Tax=Phaseolus vulgaris TaxID=3885 RepID=UPI0035CC50F6